MEKLDDNFNDTKDLSIENSTHTLYGNLWESFTLKDIIEEPKILLEKRINTPSFSLDELNNQTVLDLGCGSGRYTLALSTYGCKSVIGYDMGEQGLQVGKSIVKKYIFQVKRFIHREMTATAALNITRLTLED